MVKNDRFGASGLFPFGRGDGQRDAAARTEFAVDLHPSRPARLDEVGENAVDGLLMERMVVAEGIEVEFEGFALNAEFVRDIPDADVSEVGLAGHGTQARELGAVKQDFVIALGVGVDEGLKFCFVRRIRIFGMAA